MSIPDEATVVAHEYFEFAVQEIIENALLHHAGGTPAIEVTVREAPTYTGWLELVVEDDGPGIPREELDVLSSHDSGDPLTHSSGIGLWMAYWIVYQSGGDFSVTNTEQGCRVTISLPTPATSSEPAAAAALDGYLS